VALAPYGVAERLQPQPAVPAPPPPFTRRAPALRADAKPAKVPWGLSTARPKSDTGYLGGGVSLTLLKVAHKISGEIVRASSPKAGKSWHFLLSCLNPSNLSNSSFATEQWFAIGTHRHVIYEKYPKQDRFSSSRAAHLVARWSAASAALADRANSRSARSDLLARPVMTPPPAWAHSPAVRRDDPRPIADRSVCDCRAF
jgi:hypothetical protein